MSLYGAKVLVTGAGGFIGSHLVEELVKIGSSVKALVKYNSRNDFGMIEELPSDIQNSIEVITGDVRDPFMVRKAVAGSDVIFHLASLIAIPYSYSAPSSYVETNICGAVNIAQAALESKVSKLVHTSTSEVYGTARYVPIDESHPLQAQSPYAASKIGADKIIESYHLSFGLPVTTIRPFNSYGPRQSARAIIPTIIVQALQKDHVDIGMVDAIRDFTYVMDTVKGFIRIAECQTAVGQTVNVGSGKSVTIGELAEVIFQVMETQKKIRIAPERLRPKNSEVMQLLCNNQKACEMIGWTPETDLRQGLRATINYCMVNFDRYKAEIYNQ